MKDNGCSFSDAGYTSEYLERVSESHTITSTALLKRIDAGNINRPRRIAGRVWCESGTNHHGKSKQRKPIVRYWTYTNHELRPPKWVQWCSAKLTFSALCICLSFMTSLTFNGECRNIGSSPGGNLMNEISFSLYYHCINSLCPPVFHERRFHNHIDNNSRGRCNLAFVRSNINTTQRSVKLIGTGRRIPFQSIYVLFPALMWSAWSLESWI